MDERDPRARLWALALTSAAAASMHELTWGALVSRWVGNSAWSVALALGAFMLGQGVGALRAPRGLASRRAGDGYARCELRIGVGALFALACFARVPPPSSVVGGGVAVDVVAAALVMLAPAVAMGATLPWLVAWRGEATTPYRWGLAGAVVGALAAASVVAPHMGYGAVGALAVALNLAVSATARAWSGTSAITSVTVVEAPRGSLARYAAAGFLGLSAQVVWHRAVVPYAGVSGFALASVVVVYVGAQWWGFRRGDRARDEGVALVAATALPLVGLSALGAAGALSPTRDMASAVWAIRTLAVVTVAVAPGAWALGVIQARALSALDARDDRAAAVARVVGLGTVLAAAGPVVTSLALLPWLGPRGALVALAAPLVWVVGREARTHGVIAAAAATALAVVAPGPRWFLGPQYDELVVVHARHGVQDTTAVVRHDLPVELWLLQLVSNGVSYSGDSLFAQRYMRMLAHLPARAVPRVQRALVICLGTGTTLDALRAYDPERIDAVDIDPAIDETLRRFAHVHHGAPDDPRVRVHHADGDHFLRTTSARYDVITLEPPPPRAPGGATLYTREFYRAAAARLTADGALAQWLPLHDMNAAEARGIVATFVDAFPEAGLYLVERNEAVLLSRAPRRSLVASPAPEGIGFDGVDLVAETFVADATVLRAISGDARRVTALDPWPEMVPLADGGDGLDAWAEALRTRAQCAPDTAAAAMVNALPAFVRARDGRATAAERARAAASLRGWMSRHPDDPYVQSMQGYGPLLDARLTRLSREGMPDALAAQTRARLDAMRARATQR